MTYQKVTVVGGGTLGSQIAFMAAFAGKDTTIWGRSEGSLERAKTRVDRWENEVKAYYDASDADIESARDHLNYTTSLEDALSGADLVIEALPENAETKTDFYEKFDKLADPETVVVTNSSTMMPSQFAETTGRPEKFLGYHFANEIWKNNTAEIMSGPDTDATLPETLEEFSREIKMVPIMVKKEQPGYVLNSLLVPFLDAGTDLWVRDVADPETVDKTWMIGTGAPVGPFGIMDLVGLNTVYEINKGRPDEKSQHAAEKIKERMDKGLIGQETGQGFYTYPNPAYLEDDFLS
ncbi:3-hydroxyacyl-CoA dehydrogenase [Weissella viridescens]|uniref:3-hydroxyacyl-CoA dehydrogenase n=1 Tax=Weissella viridescens TaxID=1629 RepID=UPI001D080851|nr:3-hydroxyacyl-CoA dehydrogenase [Weissella viridescens]MCB6840499.1 3-hydroxyacyl-CoA dehydrogenase [Weissella viridescens]MCB6847232.1 3-hydroxyacyl-CoA dehydrogenase [Weissella viridescens]